MHKILTLGAAIIAIAVMSQQPAQAQNKLAGLVQYPTETKELQVQPTTLKILHIQITEAPTQTLQIWQVKAEREETKVMIFWRGGILQSKQRIQHPWRAHLLTSPLRLPIGNRADERAFFRPLPTQPINAFARRRKQSQMASARKTRRQTGSCQRHRPTEHDARQHHRTAQKECFLGFQII